MAESSSCADYTTCDSCTDNSTYTHYCHWCSFDNACHAVGSVYGCAYGVSCYAIDSCMRQSPEPRGDLPPPAGATAGVLCLAASLLMCMSCCLLVSCKVKDAYLNLLPRGQGGG
eukprot:CAMPEP_0182463738 /NCGR_PEP_ID=MMETSP1319-20130603/7899_1 /TAXON_ID=172717 /ORGANISM="Bolidomonas pacifica, Strain RCC208" /LENGTH=113 /DNA_ID=CAMNT_0024663319 /DNA_START=35 /DNA_END=372 /DNA_ORIENTATION=-